MQEETFQPLNPSPPRTWLVVVMLIAVALIANYLWAYAITNALVAAEVISRWPAGHDPRPMRMCIGFIIMMSVFAGLGAIAQILSRRQLKRIDRIVEA